MQIFEEMKAALEAQAPLDIQPPFQIGQAVTYKVPVISKEPRDYIWQSHHGVILAISAFAEMVLIQSDDEPGIPWRWLWWGYVEKVSHAQK